MEFYKKYKHIGNSYVGVPRGWESPVEEALIKAEKTIWPQWWIPLFIKRLIHYLATDNSVYRIKYKWAYNLRKKLTKGQMISDIKEKYGTLRIYGRFSEETDLVIRSVINYCNDTCQKCGKRNEVETVDNGWVYTLCSDCRSGPEFSPRRIVLIEKEE